MSVLFQRTTRNDLGLVDEVQGTPHPPGGGTVKETKPVFKNPKSAREEKDSQGKEPLVSLPWATVQNASTNNKPSKFETIAEKRNDVGGF
jgi:hypothetical protein